MGAMPKKGSAERRCKKAAQDSTSLSGNRRTGMGSLVKASWERWDDKRAEFWTHRGRSEGKRKDSTEIRQKVADLNSGLARRG